nr:integrase, catalytic region, zinc finger, CCHC-type, peptidase aspartic, catalytic [Tanacetum cinerariifolium]
MKFEKDHLCSACEQGKIRQKHHKSKTDFASHKPLYLLHMDLCGRMIIHGTHGYSLFIQKMKLLKRNRTLVEAARTVLTFANLPLFLWAEAIITACFTQNRLIIDKRFDKTPYELINNGKLNIKLFRVFGCRCYLLNDYEDVGKVKAKGDIGVFVGYSKESVAFRIYNKRTHDELSDKKIKQIEADDQAIQTILLGLPEDIYATHVLREIQLGKMEMIRCYNCRGVGLCARNCTVRPRRRDATYLQTQLLIAQKEEA